MPQVLAGLAYLYEKGIVLNSIAFATTVQTERRTAKIRVNVRVARLGGAPEPPISATTEISPELITGADIDGRSDLFSAGSILYEMTTGEQAFRGDTPARTMLKIINDEPEMELIPREPEWKKLRAVIELALRKDPKDRYRDARGMSADLTEALRDLRCDDDGAPMSPASRSGRG